MAFSFMCLPSSQCSLVFCETKFNLFGINLSNSHKLKRVHSLVPINCHRIQAHEYTLVPSFTKEYKDDTQVNKMEELKKEVLSMLGRLDDPSDCMNMIDTLQRLGIDYHFEEEIEAMLRSHYWIESSDDDDDLYDVSLRFRLFRQHGYSISPDCLNKFKDKEGRFKQGLTQDLRGILSLYEASHLSFLGEDTLTEGHDFASKNLEASIGHLEPALRKQVEHTLGHPMHKSLSRFDARHQIETWHERHGDTHNVLVELAHLDFNYVQSVYKKDLHYISRWWAELGLEKEFKFTRIQPLKWFMWTIAMLPEPKYSNYRIQLTKVIGFIYIIDDIYDVYGSMDELYLFTDAINKWRVDAKDQLPGYMRKCLLELFNITNEIGDMVMKEHGWSATRYMRKSWEILCKAFLVEANWFRSKYLPKSKEYLSNGMISSGVHVVLVHLYFLLGQGIEMGTIEKINNNLEIISCPAMILRLWDDFGPSTDEMHGGVDGSYIECYMKEHHGSTVEIARARLMNLITDTWKKLNKECLEHNSFSPSFKNATLNVARMVQIMYQIDNDHHLLNLKDHIDSLIIQHIPV